MNNSPDNLLTPYYHDQLRVKHAGKPWGGAGWSWIPQVCELIVRGHIQSPRVLDYGAGRRTFARDMRWAMPHVEVFEYDPGVPGIDIVPTGTYDIVLCSDVLEHVERQFVDATLARLRSYCLYGAVINIACSPSKSLLPDGTNAHVTVEPAQWWDEKLKKHWKTIQHMEYKKNFSLYAINNSKD